MPKVTVLPDHIASQIAAGEVVERPASVIKELVENSIDAGASHVEISVSQDMRDIRVADNGFGMEPEDAVLAFQRHATSKIVSAEDLSTLSTLGFRGEALPSIASISKFTCYTRTKDAQTGTRVDIKDGIVTAAETGCAQGTVMEISDLFYNVPARLKFLKKAGTEFGHAQEIVQSLAVAHPEIVFELKRADSIAFKTGGTGDTAIAASEAKLFSGQESLCEVTGSDERFGLKVRGLVARPNHFRGDRKGILSMVNQRPVRCPLTYKALEYAYSDLIPRGRHPFAVINIEIDPEHIDVNIHPTKKEIKYTDSNAVYMALHRAIGDALRQPRKELFNTMRSEDGLQDPQASPWSTPEESNQNDRLYDSDTQTSRAVHEGGGRHLPLGKQAAEALAQSLRLYSRGDDDAATAPHLLYSAPQTGTHGSSEQEQFNFAPDAAAEILAADALQSSHYNTVPSLKTEQLTFGHELNYIPHAASASSLSLPLDTDISLPAGWRLAGYIHNTYFLFETPAGMEIIEQHIAHERLLYERILAGQTVPGRLTEHVQRLCISAPLHLTPQQIDVLKEGIASFARLGFDFEFMDNGTVSCLQVPLELAHQNYATIIQKMIEDVSAVESASIELEATKSIACQSAIKNGMTLSASDILKLVSAWLKTPRNDTCPHGRPVRLKLSMDRLFEMFHPV